MAAHDGKGPLYPSTVSRMVTTKHSREGSAEPQIFPDVPAGLFIPIQISQWETHPQSPGFRQSRVICKCLLEESALAICSLSSLMETRLDLSKLTGVRGTGGARPQPESPRPLVLWLSPGHWIISPTGL